MYFKKTGVKIPAPEDRPCLKHGKPVCPSRWVNGHFTQCSKCIRLRCTSVSYRLRREKRWDKEFIACVYHRDRRCSRANYVSHAARYCATCCGRLSPTSQIRRRKLWKEKFISCIKHPHRRANLSRYVKTRKRKCASCWVHHPDGSLKNVHRKLLRNRNNRRNDNRRMFRAARQPFGRKSIESILRMRTGFKIQGA